jgi:hypothetical protein
MIVIGLSSYPLESSEQVIKCAYELPRLPEYIKGRGSYGYITREQGAEGIQIYEFDSAKVDEAMWDIVQPYTKFYDIPGYRYELKVAFKARDAMKRMLELK